METKVVLLVSFLFFGMLFIYLFIFSAYECLTCMFMCHVCFWCPQRPEEEGIRSPGLGVSDNLWPCGAWELNPSPLEEQTVPLNTEPSLQPVDNVSGSQPMGHDHFGSKNLFIGVA